MTISTTGPYDPAVHQTAAASWEKGRTAGLHDGYDEGYLRGRANAIVARMKAVFLFDRSMYCMSSQAKAFRILRWMRRSLPHCRA